jgi:hypothetical protein
LDHNLLRYEIAFQRQLPFIKTLADLRNSGNLERLSLHLSRTWDDIIIGTGQTDITSGLLAQYVDDAMLAKSTYGFWQELRKQVSRATYCKRLREFRQSVATIDGGIHSQIAELFKEKTFELFVQ